MRFSLVCFVTNFGIVVLAAALSAAASDVEIEASGVILDARGASGKVWMVVEENDGRDRRCGLFVADGRGKAAGERVRDTVCTSVLSRLEPAGGAEAIVVVATNGGLSLARTGEVVLEGPDFERARVPDGFAEPGRFCLAMLGELRCFSFGADSRIAAAGVAKLPIEARRSAGGLILRSARVEAIRGAYPMFATWPKARGSSRLVVQLITIGQDESNTVECWLRLPAAERVHDVWYVLIDGEPHAILTTSRSDKLQIFAEKLLRIFPLRSDRTRQGVRPIFAIETEMNLWQSGGFELLDANGDGRDDLVFLYWKGLRKARLAIDVYLGTGQSWQKKARSTDLAFDEAERGFLDLKHDFDGDGIVDLVVLADDRVQVFPRIISTRGKNILAEDPMWTSASLEKRDQQSLVISAGGEGVGSDQRQDRMVTFDDVDGDGRVEILLISERTLIVHRPSASPAG